MADADSQETLPWETPKLGPASGDASDAWVSRFFKRIKESGVENEQRLYCHLSRGALLTTDYSGQVLLLSQAHGASLCQVSCTQ